MLFFRNCKNDKFVLLESQIRIGSKGVRWGRPVMLNTSRGVRWGHPAMSNTPGAFDLDILVDQALQENTGNFFGI